MIAPVKYGSFYSENKFIKEKMLKLSRIFGFGCVPLFFHGNFILGP